MTGGVRRSHAMDAISQCWLWLGRKMKRRPLFVTGCIIGAVIFFAAAVWTYKQANDAQRKATEISRAFCSGQAPPSPQQTENCRNLLDRLIRNPTPEQARRLREIIRTMQ